MTDVLGIRLHKLGFVYKDTGACFRVRVGTECRVVCYEDIGTWFRTRVGTECRLGYNIYIGRIQGRLVLSLPGV